MSDSETTKPWIIEWLDNLSELEDRANRVGVVLRLLMFAYIVLHIAGLLP